MRRRALALIAVLGLAGCVDGDPDDEAKDSEDSEDTEPTDDSDVGGESDTSPPDETLRACLDRPDALPRPPAGTLPCKLIPPGLELPAAE